MTSKGNLGKVLTTLDGKAKGSVSDIKVQALEIKDQGGA